MDLNKKNAYHLPDPPTGTRWQLKQKSPWILQLTLFKGRGVFRRWLGSRSFDVRSFSKHMTEEELNNQILQSAHDILFKWQYNKDNEELVTAALENWKTS